MERESIEKENRESFSGDVCCVALYKNSYYNKYIYRLHTCRPVQGGKTE